MAFIEHGTRPGQFRLAPYIKLMYTTIVRRKPAPKNEERFNMLMPSSDIEQLRVLAAEDGSNMSAVVRRLIREETRRRARASRRDER